MHGKGPLLSSLQGVAHWCGWSVGHELLREVEEASMARTHGDSMVTPHHPLLAHGARGSLMAAPPGTMVQSPCG